MSVSLTSPFAGPVKATAWVSERTAHPTPTHRLTEGVETTVELARGSPRSGRCVPAHRPTRRSLQLTAGRELTASHAMRRLCASSLFPVLAYLTGLVPNAGSFYRA